MMPLWCDVTGVEVDMKLLICVYSMYSHSPWKRLCSCSSNCQPSSKFWRTPESCRAAWPSASRTTRTASTASVSSGYRWNTLLVFKYGCPSYGSKTFQSKKLAVCARKISQWIVLNRVRRANWFLKPSQSAEAYMCMHAFTSFAELIHWFMQTHFAPYYTAQKQVNI
jgi:hypothetical protein